MVVRVWQKTRAAVSLAAYVFLRDKICRFAVIVREDEIAGCEVVVKAVAAYGRECLVCQKPPCRATNKCGAFSATR